MLADTPQIYVPQGFFQALHPRGVPGHIVLTRKINNSNLSSRLTSTELERITESAVGLHDVSFSISRFRGLPLLLNFAAVQTLGISFPFVPSLQRNTFDIADEVEHFLHGKEIFVPSGIVYDGKRVHLLWVLDQPILNSELWLFRLLQEALLDVFREYPDQQLSIPNAKSFLPLVGTRNSYNNKVVRINEKTWRGHQSKEKIRSLLLEHIPASRRDTLELHAGVLAELKELFHARWWGTDKDSQNHQNWLKYFGVSLSPFCGNFDLKEELIAVAESLAGRPWKEISSEYGLIIDTVLCEISENRISIGHDFYPLSRPDWRETIEDSLHITCHEVESLGLYEICMEKHRRLLCRHIDPFVREKLSTFGYEKWVPKERLLLKSVA